MTFPQRRILTLSPPIFGSSMFQVLHSSAGAGKTHALVKHYLAHCLTTSNAAAYRHVLALTFTNKAAGEMKERVIQYLEQLATPGDPDARIRDLVDHLLPLSGVSEQEIARRAHACLGHMLHHWSDVAISTIDAFTRRVVQPFARDLQLDHDLRMTTEEEYYRIRAIDRLIAEVGIEDRITALLTETCLQLLHEERKWDPEKPLLELSRELSREGSIEPLKLLHDMDPQRSVELAGKLRTTGIAFRRSVNALGEKALGLLKEAHVAVEELYYGKSGIYSYFRKLCAFSEDWDPPGTYARRTIGENKWTSGKASTSAAAAIQGTSGDLIAIYNEAEQLRQDHHRDHVIRRAVLRELFPSLALHELAVRLEQVKQEDAVAFFSDLTRKVSEVVKDEPVPFIYERLGERYHHFLIDEFQDTSLQQWNALLPLIDNALATNGSALLVGDAKQAIYRWRNGEVRLFVELPRLFGCGNDALAREREDTLVRNHVEVEKLAHNHRSAATIIEFNNNIFDNLKQLLPEHLRKVYDEHEQLVRKSGPGLVKLSKLDKEFKGEARTEEMLRFTRAAVNEALADGFAPGDIAILVRSRQTGRCVSEHLVEHRHSIVSPDGLQLSGDTAIGLLIEQLRFIHCGDAAAAARVLQLQAVLNAGEKEELVDPFGGDGTIPDPVDRLRKWMRQHNSPCLRTTLSALIGDLARANGLAVAGDAQVLTLVDEAHAWSREHGQDIGGFLEHWERAGGRRSVEPPDNGSAIQVMTVHKSKGLQFPVVIIPNACMSSRGGHGERIWIRPGNAVPELEMALVRNSRVLHDVEVPELEEEKQLSLLDSLDLLYVAFTRPEQRLYAQVPEAGADEITSAILAFIKEHGSEDQLKDGERTPPWSTRRPGTTTQLLDVAGDRDSLPLVMRMEAPEQWDPADPDPYRSYGNIVHELLASVISAGDLEPALQSLVDAGELDTQKAGALHRELAPLLNGPAMAPWFGPGLKVRSECTIITRDGSSLRPDRVVEQGDVVRVLDIKTGRVNGTHDDQVRRYMEYLQELSGSRVEGALFYVRDGKLKPVFLNEPLLHGETLR